MDHDIDVYLKRIFLNDYEKPQNSGYTVDKEFQNLVEQVHSCHRCPRMEGRTRVLSSGNGPLHAKLLFIAEAPGRLGAELSGIPLTGDQTGRNFDALLKAADIDRQSIFITNAVLCNPQNKQGGNASPASSEISNCSGYLHTTIQLLQPRYVIALGLVALRALQYIEPHSITLAQHVGIPVVWYNRWLIALYHPGPKARIHRSAKLQIEDFQRLGNFIKRDRPDQVIL